MSSDWGEDLNLSLGLRSTKKHKDSSWRPGPKAFLCNFCTRKFSSPHALGGHQNAHKRERGVTRKFQNQLQMGMRPDSILHKPTRTGGGASTTTVAGVPAVGLAWGTYGVEDLMDVMWPGSFYLQTHPAPPLLDLNLKL